MPLREMRCSKCNRKLAEYESKAGQIRVQCPKVYCKTMNVVVIRDRKPGEPEENMINLLPKTAK